MARVFDGKLHVAYGMATLESSDSSYWEDPGECFAGQINGLCGTEAPGVIMLQTGLDTGEVGFKIDVLDLVPSMDDSWEEIVEASHWQEEDDCFAFCDLLSEGEPEKFRLASGEYRLRLCARGMQAGRDEYVRVRKEPAEFYSLTFWPAPLAPDAILKQTSDYAKHLHESTQRSKSGGG